MIARLHRSDACSHLANNPGTLMTEDRRKDSFAVEAVKCVGVGVTNAGRLYFDKDFAGFRAIQVKLNDFKRLFCFERDSSASLHLSHLPSKILLERVSYPSSSPSKGHFLTKSPY